MKDVATPVPQNEVRAVIKKSLENAALVNYERLSEEARIEGRFLKVFNIRGGSSLVVYDRAKEIPSRAYLNIVYTVHIIAGGQKQKILGSLMTLLAIFNSKKHEILNFATQNSDFY